MPALIFRNLNITPDEPVDTWGVEGLLTAIDRGSLPLWRRIAAAVQPDPWGPVAQDLQQALALAEDSGVAATLRRALLAARADADADARAEVQRRLRSLVERSGLTAAEFARRLGTSASRMSTYLNGKVTPSAAVLVRSETIAETTGSANPAAESHH